MLKIHKFEKTLVGVNGNLHRKPSGEGINHSNVFFGSDLSRVLKPMIWVYTKFEQNGKLKTSRRVIHK